METNASHEHKLICDGCRATIKTDKDGDYEPIPRKAIAVSLPDQDGLKKEHNFCSESCMLGHLNKRQEMREKEAKASLESVAELKTNKGQIYWDVNLLQTADGRDISYKERHSPKEYFLDEKRKSFPVMNCQDVSAVMHRIGTYKGEMSVDEIRSKLKRRAAELGCTNSLPEADKEKKKD